MKTKNRTKKQEPIDDDKRPGHYGAGFWPGEGDPIEAMRLAWMKPSEFAAWKAAKTPEDKNRIEAAAQIADAVERDAELVEQKAKTAQALAARKAEESKAAVKALEQEAHKRRYEEATIQLAKGTAATMTKKSECGCLSIFDDFRKVLCHKKPYDLTDATQARELLRFLCAEKALSEGTAQNKSDILKALKAGKVPVVANDWRPAHVFRGKLATLYQNAIGRNTTKGLYWINP